MNIKEIFYSFQGEGPLVGYPQIFIRFYGCNIHCAYCDEPDFVKDKHNYTVDRVLEELKPLLKLKPHSISITGGEPLIQVDALKELLPHLTLPVYLETNGTLPKHLAEVADLITYFSVDYKHGFDKEFLAFLDVIKGYKNVFVKYVLIRDFPIEDVRKMSKIMAAFDPNMPLIIQPVTPFSEIKVKATPADIQKAFNLASAHLKDVRIIPQTHKFMGLR